MNFAILLAPALMAAGLTARPAGLAAAPWVATSQAPPAAAPPAADAGRPAAATSDTMAFQPLPARGDSAASREARMEIGLDLEAASEGDWLRAPVGGELLTHPDPWQARHPDHVTSLDLDLDYNRVDLLRYGLWFQAQQPTTMYPRLGARLDYATGRRRVLYGAQLEQPLLPSARFALGLDMERRTDHPDLEQVDDIENSLFLLVAHEDWRDYFEREGEGAYLSWRVPDFSTVSVHARRDTWRSLVASPHVHSWFNTDRTLRGNPAIDEGTSHSVLLRLERLAHRTHRMRAGLYHWIEVERAGGAMGGAWTYTRALADVRSVVRVTPGTTLSVRAVGGAALAGALPAQKRFEVGGVDGLRAHEFGAFAGDHMALVQAEYSILLGPLSDQDGLHALAFTDTGTAWDNPAGGWDVASQRFAVDGGVGLSTEEGGMRVTVAKNLQQPDSKLVVSLRMQRPF